MRCLKPCDRIEEWLTYEGTTRETINVRVYCHGESEKSSIAKHELETLESYASLSFGSAFTSTRALLLDGK